MFSILPDLRPRDSHSLWYTSSHDPNASLSHLDTAAALGFGDNGGHSASAAAQAAAAARGGNNNNNGNGGGQHHHNQAVIERSMLGRLRADEIYMERCRANVSNLGSTWLKPPGVTKTLFQLREERREAEEHAEAVRREMLAAELAEAAEAEAGGGTGGLAGDEAMDGDEPGMDDDDDGGGRDLDEDVPDADEGGFGFDGASDDEDEDDDLDAEDDENDDADDDHAMQVERSSAGDALRQQRRIQQREFASRMATMRATEDRVRERMARGGPGDGAGDLYGADEVIDEEDQAHMLEEEDLVGAVYRDEVEPGPDMDMEADLDDEIPEAESGGGYEHTDSEASLSNSDDGDHNVSYLAPRARLPPAHPQRSSMGRGDGGPRSSIDISSILSRDGSSITGSSPQVRRRT